MGYKSTVLYRNRKTTVYVVQPMTKHPTGASVEYGEPTLVTEEEFDSRIAAAVLESLEAYGKGLFKQELAPRVSEREYKRFMREHDSVLLTLHDTGLIDITPFRQTGGGYVGALENKAALNVRDLPEKLAGIIRQVFEHAH